MGSASAPLVSVIVATYNSRATLVYALDSVRGQDFQDFEVWVVGDACTDGSHEVVEALGDPRFHWINRETNSGTQSGPNAEGLRRASGRYVAYLGHDDLWFPWHLSTLVAAIERDSVESAKGVESGKARRSRTGSVCCWGPAISCWWPDPTARHVDASFRAADELAASARSARSRGPHRRRVAARRGTRLRGRLGRALAHRRQRRDHHGRAAADDDQVSVAVVESSMRPARRVRSPRCTTRLTRDPQALAERLLIAIATEHARMRNSRDATLRPAA